MERVAIDGKDFVALSKTGVLNRRIRADLLDLDRALRILNEEAGLIEVIVLRIDAGGQLNRGLDGRAVPVYWTGNSLTLVVAAMS